MPAEIIIPDLNPIKFVETNPVQLPQYLTRHFDNYLFEDQQHEWEEAKWYDQKWQTSDVIFLQFESNFDPVTVHLVDCNDTPFISQNAVQKMVNKWEAGKYAYEVQMSLAVINEGRYWLKLVFGSTIMISEPMYIKTKWKNSLLLEYKHRRFHGDVIFETGIQFGFRVEGALGKLKPGSKDSVYEDEPLNPVLLSSTKFRSWPLGIGGQKGVPDWVVDKFNGIWTCSDVMIDGKPFAKSSESKIELREEEGYPMRGIFMDVREGVNRGSKIVQPTVDTNKRLIIVHNVEGKLFGDLTNPASSNVVPITSIE
jgi:hypothetical protein